MLIYVLSISIYISISYVLGLEWGLGLGYGWGIEAAKLLIINIIKRKPLLIKGMNAFKLLIEYCIKKKKIKAWLHSILLILNPTMLKQLY